MEFLQPPPEGAWAFPLRCNVHAHVIHPERCAFTKRCYYPLTTAAQSAASTH